MAKTPKTPAEASADAAATFADGHVDPVAPLAIPAASLAEVDAGAEEARLRSMRTRPDERMQAETADAPAGAGYILIVCGEPGFRRAGLMHASRAEYPLDFFTQAQLDAIDAEPKLELVAVGGEPIARLGPAYGEFVPALRTTDPLLAGRAAADAISSPPNRAEPGLRNRLAGDARRG